MTVANEQARSEQHYNSTTRTFTVSIRDMDRETWDGFKALAMDQKLSMGDLFRQVFKELSNKSEE